MGDDGNRQFDALAMGATKNTLRVAGYVTKRAARGILRFLLTNTPLKPVIAEFISIRIMSSITGITYDELLINYSNSLIFVLFSVPARIIQGLTTFVLYKLPFTLLNFGKVAKLTKGIVRNLVGLNTSLFLNLILIAMLLNSYINFTDKSSEALILLVLTVMVAIIQFILHLIQSVKTSRAITKEKEENLHTLYWFMALIDNLSDIEALKQRVKSAIEKIEGGKQN